MSAQEEQGDIGAGIAALGLVRNRRALWVKRGDADGGHYQVDHQQGIARRGRGHGHPHGDPGRADRGEPAPSHAVADVAEERLNHRGGDGPGKRRQTDHAVGHVQPHRQDGVEHARPQRGKVRGEVPQRDGDHGLPAGKNSRGGSTLEASALQPGRPRDGGTFAGQAYAPRAHPACHPQPLSCPKWVYPFREGGEVHAQSAGGQRRRLGRNDQGRHAGAGPGFTITTAACLEYYANDEELPEGLDAQVDVALAEVESARWPEVRRPGESAAGLGAIRRPRLHARHDGHGAQSRPERGHAGGPDRRHRRRALRLGRLSPVHPGLRLDRAGRGKPRIRGLH